MAENRENPDALLVASWLFSIFPALTLSPISPSIVFVTFCTFPLLCYPRVAVAGLVLYSNLRLQ